MQHCAVFIRILSAQQLHDTAGIQRHHGILRTARQNRRQDGTFIFRHQNEKCIFRRFFQQFEQSILRRSVHVLRMANEENASVAVARIHSTFRSNAACSVHFNFRIARINAGDIGMIILLDLSAGGTLSAWLFSRALTQQCHRQHARRGQLADAFRTGQQNALRKASVQGMLPSCFQFFISQQTGKRHDGSAFPQKSPSITQMDAVSVYHPSRRNSM